MNARIKAALLSAMCICIVLLTVSACQNSPSPEPRREPTQATGARANASVTGTVTYRERIALSPGATLVVQLRDVSLQDASSILIAEQVMPNSGQVADKVQSQVQPGRPGPEENLPHNRSDKGIRRPPSLY